MLACSRPLQVRRRRSVHELRRHPVGQVVQDDMFGEDITRACRPRYRIEPHSFGFTHIGAAIFRRLHAPQWSGMPARPDLGVRAGMTTRVMRLERLGDQMTRIETGDAGEAGAEPFGIGAKAMEAV